jgi:muramoyltetrapeptide carboxypeptidase
MMTAWVRQEKIVPQWSKRKLNFIGQRPERSITGVLIGGNLSVWNSLLGTRFETPVENYILFLEEIDESLFKIDRLLTQLSLSNNAFKIKAIIFGNFLNCKDQVSLFLKHLPNSGRLKHILTSPAVEYLQPLRKPLNKTSTLKKLFINLADRLDVPVAYGMPVGHGPEVSPLPLGAKYRLTPEGRLEIISWDWLNPR